MTHFAKTATNRIKRLPKRGQYDRESIYRILDEALICHVGFVEDKQPYVIPINFARVGDTIILHGAKASRLLKHIEAGHLVCLEAANASTSQKFEALTVSKSIRFSKQ